ncbi:hypothetical protein CMI37_22260 [Candidatus Pacearchaeota archaeon]|nr:hypothetical protein [Candidatus Pacearchaeota archaeon]|tara:strand:- start:26565 stop:26795 length:231 start_codon:yes stop_codon:yes gene_type:complete
MASLDFVYDMKEKLEKDNIEFAICIVRHSEEESKVDMHLNLLSDESADVVCRAFHKVCEYDEGRDDEDTDIFFDNE